MSIVLSQSEDTPNLPPQSADAIHYPNEIPAFAEAELARLYGHAHSSVPFFETSRPLDGASTYVARSNGQISALLVFRVAGGVADVLNEFIVLSGQELRRFADYVFANFRSVWAVRFQAVQADVAALPYPYQKHNSKENWVITLPATPDEYTASLGKATRDKVKRYGRKVAKDFPSFSVEFHEKEDIAEENVRALIALSRARITSKRKLFGIDEEETRRILAMARRCGVMNVTRIDGRLCAGLLAYRVGTEHLTEVIAHDPQYNDYRMGALCYHATICESIGRGATKFHLGGGREDYKARFLGVRQDMDRLIVYRSPAAMALHPQLVARTALTGLTRRAKVWMLAHEKSPITRSVFFALSLLRRLRGRDG